jgi:Uri superfamily endonuclease
LRPLLLNKNQYSAKKCLRGIYVLLVQVEKNVEVKVGALGTITFSKGLYAYVGSAQANMEKRIKRHLRNEKRKFWHIDYLLDDPKARILRVFFKEGNKTEECKTADCISEEGKPIASFGSSDCKCKTHLFHIRNYKFLKNTMKVFLIET